MQIMHPVSAKSKSQIKSRNTMILQNHSHDQDKSFQKLLELGYIYLAHCTLIWYALHVIFTLGI